MPGKKRSSSSLFTVLLAFGANILVAIAKTVAAVITGSASLVAEAAHSWADAGNEIFLIQAERSSVKPRDTSHPGGYGRDAYIWSLFAAVGLFTAGAVVSIMHGVSALSAEEEDTEYFVGYLVLGAAFVFEGISFIQSYRQAHAKASSSGTGTFEHVLRTSNPTLRAVFAEDSAALVGLVIAFLGLLLHELTGNPFWDALGSILIGVLLAIVAVVLIERNRRFLLGEPGPDRAWQIALSTLLKYPEIEKVTYLHIEYLGPERFYLVAAVDLTGDDPESDVAAELQEIEAELERSSWVTEAVLTLSRPGAQALSPAATTDG
jgi:cation diffusion facilitator family transporter